MKWIQEEMRRTEEGLVQNLFSPDPRQHSVSGGSTDHSVRTLNPSLLGLEPGPRVLPLPNPQLTKGSCKTAFTIASVDRDPA